MCVCAECVCACICVCMCVCCVRSRDDCVWIVIVYGKVLPAHDHEGFGLRITEGGGEGQAKD
jgi:hypothetical protein